ncbi:MAG TPA: efflux RND transporter periplasmic adaptor subunit [Desulfobulbaceae bacterium]|nr:efflux RND transporter periplasmic adaptor subunit [Desulfobulbaceae bacterium]
MVTRKKFLTYLILFLVVLIPATGAVILHKRRALQVAHVPKETLAPWALHVATVTDEPVTSGFPALAKIASRQPVTIMARITGRILEMGPREGVAVKKGDLLVRIDTSEIEKKIHSLQAQLIAARAEATRTGHELVREEKLFKDGGSSASAVDARRTAAVAAKQKVASLEHQTGSLEVEKEYGVIKSPVNGIIAARLAEPGDMCVPGHPLNRITAAGGALVRVELPQSILHQVRPGAPVVLSFGDQRMTVQVSRIFPSVDARAFGFVEADVDAIPFDLPSGSRIDARIILRRVTDGFRVSYGSLLCGEGDAQCRVFTIVQEDKKKTKNSLKMVDVQVRLRGHDAIAVTGALKVGDRVVIAHESVLLQLHDGDAVTVAPGELP